MNIQHNISLKPYNTFQIDVQAAHLATITSDLELHQLIQQNEFKQLPKLILGGGSNLLLTQDYPGLVIKLETKGRTILQETNDHVILQLAAGENWHDTVTFAVENNWGGIENLAYIPGTVGAAPVQNIAAYGQNLIDTFYSLEALEIATGKTRTFTSKDCQFGYRESIFKHQLKDKYVITQVCLKLTKRHALETSYFSLWTKYESIEAELAKTARQPYQIKDVYQAVINIRQRQLPDWTITPTVGSFFTNPTVPRSILETLKQQVPELQFYPADQLTYKQLSDPEFDHSQFVKLPAGRLLDHLGWKGKQIGHVSTYPTHALIVTHDGQATGSEVLSYTQSMQDDVQTKLGISLESEVAII